MRFSALILALIAPLSLAACDEADEDARDVVIVGNPQTAYAQDLGDSPAARLIRGATAPALVQLDAEARIAPGLAESWIATDDGMSYIFRLAGPAPGETAVTATEVREALVDRIAEMRDTPMGADLALIDAIIARTGRVLEIQIARPLPDFLQLLAQPELALPSLDEASASTRLDRDNRALVASGEDRKGRLKFVIAPPREAVELFQDGRAEILLGGGLEALPYAELGGLMRGLIRLDPVSGLFGLVVNGDEGFLAEAANREAVAMAIDRDALMTPFGIGGWIPARSLLPPTMSRLAGQGPAWQTAELEARVATASARVAAWKAPGREAPRLTVSLPEGKGGDLLFEQLRSNLAKTGIGLLRVGPRDRADLALIDAVATYSHPLWYFHRLTCRAQPRGCDTEADAALTAAQALAPGQDRDNAFGATEAAFVRSARYIPFGPPIRFSLVRGGIDGFAVNSLGYHPLAPLTLSPGSSFD